MNLLEQVQYKAALIVSGCWQGTSRVRLYEELGWESLSDRRWCRRLTTLFKILNGNTPAYLAEHIPVRSMITQSLRRRSAPIPIVRTERYQNSFFPYSLKMWNELSDDTRSKPSVTAFKHHLNSFIRPIGHSSFGVRDKIGLQLLTRIRVNFSDLREHRYNHNFNCIKPNLCLWKWRRNLHSLHSALPAIYKSPYQSPQQNIRYNCLRCFSAS